MKMRQILLACATVMMLTTSSVWAVDQMVTMSKAMIAKETVVAVTRTLRPPEIDVASGTQAIALLIGALWLAGERVRSQRSSKLDE